MNYNIQVYELPKNDNLDIFNENNNLVINSNFENYPLFTLGYHYFIGRTRNAMTIVDKLETKSEFYYVVNPFESIITNYDENINNLTNLYIKQDINTNEFYKFWEICFLFDIADETNINIMSYEDKGEIQAIKIYRKKFYEKQSKKDKYVKKENADLIICNNNQIKENQLIEILLNQLINILTFQKKNGNLIIKIDDIYTTPTVKIIYLLTTLYEKCYIYKPFFSRTSDNEKFIICKNFNDLNTKNIIKNLNTILESSKNNYISDIFVNITPDLLYDLYNYIKFTNIKLVNQQQIMINDIVKYIKENNYFGNKYHEYRDKQIESTKWWIKNFYPPSVNLYEKNKDELEKLYKSSQEKLKSELEKFNEGLI